MSAVLEREARVFARYLVRVAAPPYVVAQYVAAHAARGALSAGTRFDRWTVALARIHPVAAFVMDAAARLIAPRGLLRCKLVLLLAVLESSAATHTRVDGAWGPWLVALAGLALRGSLFVIAAIVGVVVLVPARALAALGGDPR